MLLPKNFERYQRQMILDGFGEAAQLKLANARVLVIGAGGLGCPALQYLAAAGVGRIGIADADRVALSNLHRQVLFTEQDLGKLKAAAAAARLQLLNHQVVFDIIPEMITAKNAERILSQYDVIIDGSDNFPTRYLVNDAAVLLNKPLVYGAVSGYEGQAAVFTPGVHYRDLFPDPPAPGTIPDCTTAGVLGFLPGVIGAVMAGEAIKLITGVGEPLTGRLLVYRALTQEQFIFSIPSQQTLRHMQSSMPASLDELRQTDYGAFCGLHSVPEITPVELAAMKENSDLLIVDIREPGELPLSTGFAHMLLPLSEINREPIRLTASMQEKGGNAIMVFFCQSGKRSAQLLSQHPEVLAGSALVYSLQGGIDAWNEYSSKHASGI
ncbi:HesA/MoeB/ThiF family protein [Flavihumibacter petaseus]|uniref:Molybdopterin-synthase adenylyltransferase n=1 Tax=Flavihumibacter petaseus NBRC 106054 TaxID=1220578 RepID=A0A0E9N3R8_9BACT|nr:HesA/MoeB/ThiF family protein [Flavihumibacter petaseus]GAO44423.1 putative adenylyltransferase/sulfurtransferase MoeZ [Flavihumibacter petaseus NBRC 106054]